MDGGRGGETSKQRANRELLELLGEVRVALPGVQVLFAFLLALPFTGDFKSASAFLHNVYFATLIATTLATAFLITPSAFHRMRFRQHDREYVLIVCNRLAIVGIALLGVAMSGVILLVSDYLFDTAVAAVTTGLMALTFFGLWYLLPLSRRFNSKDHD